MMSNMHVCQKIGNFVIGVLAVCPAFSEGEDLPLVKAVPAGFRVNYHDMKSWNLGKNISRGTELALYLKMEGEGRVECRERYGKEDKNWHDTMLLKDSNIKNLGEFKGVGLSEEYVGVDQYKIYLSFERFPSPGSKWLKLTGEIPVCLFIDEQVTNSVPLELKKGEAATAGDFKATVVESLHSPDINLMPRNSPQPHQVNIRVESKEKKHHVVDINFKDKEGNDLPLEKDRVRKRIEIVDHQEVFLTYSFREVPENVQISITYLHKKEMMLPLDMTFDLCPSKPKEEDAGQ